MIKSQISTENIEKLFKYTARGSATGLCLMHTITSILSLWHKVIKSSQTTPF